MDENPALKRPISILIGILTFLLIGFGFVILGYLGYRVYQTGGLAGFSLSSSNITQDSRSLGNISLPKAGSPQQIASTSSDASASSSAFPFRKFSDNDLKLAIQTATINSLSGPDYDQIRNSVNQATAEEDPQKAYQDYKTAFNLMNNAYQTSKNQEVKYIMVEIRTYCTTLPNFRSSDMEVPT